MKVRVMEEEKGWMTHCVLCDLKDDPKKESFLEKSRNFSRFCLFLCSLYFWTQRNCLWVAACGVSDGVQEEVKEHAQNLNI